MKILVTGAGGGLGGEIPHVFNDDELALCDRAVLNVTDEDAVLDKVRSERPDVIIHAAAYTAVDRAEDDHAGAVAVNVVGTENVAKAALEVGAVLVYPSTDYVFDGTKTEPYTEDDRPNPLGVYGQTKLDGEQAAQTINDKTFVVRTSWLYSQTGKSFVTTMLRLFAEKDSLQVVSDEISTPTYARDFAKALKQLIATEAYGTYHLSHAGETSWYNYAREIARQSKAQITIAPTTAALYGLPAKRPSHSTLDSSKARALGVRLPRWQDGLENFFADRANG